MKETDRRLWIEHARALLITEHGYSDEQARMMARSLVDDFFGVLTPQEAILTLETEPDRDKQ